MTSSNKPTRTEVKQLVHEKFKEVVENEEAIETTRLCDLKTEHMDNLEECINRLKASAKELEVKIRRLKRENKGNGLSYDPENLLGTWTDGRYKYASNRELIGVDTVHLVDHDYYYRDFRRITSRLTKNRNNDNMRIRKTAQVGLDILLSGDMELFKDFLSL